MSKAFENLSSLNSSITTLRSNAALDPERLGANSCSPSSMGEILEIIAREINQTVLPRLLGFSNEMQDRVEIRVTARQVTNVEYISSELISENAMMNLDKLFVVGQDRGVQTLAESLRTFAARTSRLFIRRDVVKHRGSISNVGVPIDAILATRFSQAQAGQQVPSKSVASRIEALRTEAHAYLRFDSDRLITREGNETALEKLDRFANATLRFTSSDGTPLEENSLCAIVTLQDTFVCASVDNNSHFFYSDLASVSEILSQSQAGQ